MTIHRCTYMVGGLGTVDGGGDWGVAVGSSVVDLGIGVSLCLCFCVGAGCHKGQNLRGKAPLFYTL